ncbi:MAG: methanogenesis marker 2 protein, partial [Methanobacteriota archaeon]
ISNPGALGSAGMLMEASGVGGRIAVDMLPKPEEVDILQWLKAYQGCGFVVTCESSATPSVISEFSRHGLEAAACGSVVAERKLTVTSSGANATLFDFSRDTLGCRPPAKNMNVPKCT